MSTLVVRWSLWNITDIDSAVRVLLDTSSDNTCPDEIFDTLMSAYDYIPPTSTEMHTLYRLYSEYMDCLDIKAYAIVTIYGVAKHVDDTHHLKYTTELFGCERGCCG